MTKGIYSEKTDVWSFGITMIEILTRKKPYGDKLPTEVVAFIVGQLLSPISEIPEWCNIETKQILTKCFSYDSKDRPTFKV